jgi:Tfp pilus assembly protein PilO
MKTMLFVIGMGWAFAQSPDLKKQLEEAKRDADFQRLKKIDAQIQNLKAQVQNAMEPMMKEHDEAYKRLCATEKLEPTECDVDSNAETIKKKAKVEAKPPSDPSKPATVK